MQGQRGALFKTAVLCDARETSASRASVGQVRPEGGQRYRPCISRTCSLTASWSRAVIDNSDKQMQKLVQNASAPCSRSIFQLGYTLRVHSAIATGDKAVEGRVLLSVHFLKSLIKARLFFFCELAFLYTISSVAWIAVEIWLPTGNKRLGRSQDAFLEYLLFPTATKLNMLRRGVHVITILSTQVSRHPAHGPCMKKALNVLSEELFFFNFFCCAMHTYDSR